MAELIVRTLRTGEQAHDQVLLEYRRSRHRSLWGQSDSLLVLAHDVVGAEPIGFMGPSSDERKGLLRTEGSAQYGRA